MDKHIAVSSVEINVKDNSMKFKLIEVFNNLKDLNDFLENNTGVFSVNLKNN